MAEYRIAFTRLDLMFALCDYGEFDVARPVRSTSDSEVKRIGCLAGEALLSREFGRQLDASIAAGGVEFVEGTRRALKRKRAKRLVSSTNQHLSHPLPEFLFGREDRSTMMWANASWRCTKLIDLSSD